MSRKCGSSKPAPTPLNSEAAKPTRNAKTNCKERRPIRQGQERYPRNPPRYHLQRGAGRECVDETAKNRSSATTLARGSEAKLDRRKKRTQEVTVLCHSQSSQNTQIALGYRAGRDWQDEKCKNTKKRQSCATIEWPDYPDHGRH